MLFLVGFIVGVMVTITVATVASVSMDIDWRIGEADELE